MHQRPARFSDDGAPHLQSDFIGNIADTKGGAVYNRGGSTTTMVNCIVAGNKANSLGGGTCNAIDTAAGFDPTGPTTFNLHNCLLAGNLADTAFNDGGGHLNRNGAVGEMINCTVVKNVAVGNYGGIENVGDAGVLEVQNCIVWGNADGGGNGEIDNQLHFSGTAPQGLEVDGNVIEDCTGTCFPGSGTNKGDDPVFLDGGTNATWNGSAGPFTQEYWLGFRYSTALGTKRQGKPKSQRYSTGEKRLNSSGSRVKCTFD